MFDWAAQLLWGLDKYRVPPGLLSMCGRLHGELFPSQIKLSILPIHGRQKVHGLDSTTRNQVGRNGIIHRAQKTLSVRDAIMHTEAQQLLGSARHLFYLLFCH